MLTRLELERFTQAERERKARIRRAWDAYDGELTDPLKPTKSDPQGKDNVKINYAKLIVNKSKDFLLGFDLDFEVNGKPESPEEVWLEQCLEKNRKMVTLHRWAVNGGITGHAFLRLRSPDPARYGHPYPRVIVWNSEWVDVRWDPEDFERVIRYVYTWHGIDPVLARPAAFRQVIERDGERWVITDEKSFGGARWQVTAEEVWPYPWCPVIDNQNQIAPNEFWGMSDLEPDILAAIEAVNFSRSNANRILRTHAHPKTWGRGFNAAQVDTSVESITVFDSDTAELHNLEMLSDLSSLHEHTRDLREALHELARIPEVATGKVEDLGQLSGLALQILYRPLCELTEGKRLTYGQALCELGSRLLELGGQGQGHSVKPQWPSLLPRDPKGEAETATLWETLGVSRDTIQTKLGFDPQSEAKKKAQERKSDAEFGNQLMQRMSRGGDAAQNDTGEDEDQG